MRGSFDVGTGLNPLAVQFLQDVFEPKGRREHAQLMQSLAILADPHVSRTLAGLPKEQQGEIFRQMFTYMPTGSRRLFRGERNKTLLWPEQKEITEPGAPGTPPLKGEGLLKDVPEIPGVPAQPGVTRREPIFFTPPPQKFEITSEEQYKRLHPPRVSPWSREAIEGRKEVDAAKAALKTTPVKVPPADRWEYTTDVKGVEKKRQKKYDAATNSFLPDESAPWLNVHPPVDEETKTLQKKLLQERVELAELTKQEKKLKATHTKEVEKTKDIKAYFSSLDKAYHEYANLKYRMSGSKEERPSEDTFWMDDAWSAPFKRKWKELTGKEAPYAFPSHGDISAPSPIPFMTPWESQMKGQQMFGVAPFTPTQAPTQAATPPPATKTKSGGRFTVLGVE